MQNQGHEEAKANPPTREVSPPFPSREIGEPNQMRATGRGTAARKGAATVLRKIRSSGEARQTHYAPKGKDLATKQRAFAGKMKRAGRNALKSAGYSRTKANATVKKAAKSGDRRAIRNGNY